MENKKQVLIIEDDKTIRRALEEKFHGAGFDVIIARNGKEGLTLGINERPDAIVLDIIMPEMDGMEALKALRKHEEWGAHVPVLVLTNANDPKRIREAIERNVSQYLVKSDWNIEDVVKKVSAMIGI